ncbi:MAG: caspase family protein [Elusimicrobiota bacterium]|nr:caspase family protein [Elusimicrobiota bacterium]
MKRLLAAALLACACAPSRVALERPGRTLDLAVGVLPVSPSKFLSSRKAEGLNATLAGRMDKLGVLRSVEPVDSRRAEGVDLVLAIDAMDARYQVTVRVLSAATGRQLHAFNPKLPFNEPGGISPEAVVNGLTAAFSDGGPGARALQAERSARPAAPASPAPAAAAAAAAGVSREELKALLAEAVKAAPAAPVAPVAVGASAEADLPVVRRPERPDDLAVVIGVQDYADLPPATHARRDAEAMRRQLLALGVPERNLVLLTDARAGRSSLEKHLEAWLPRLVKPSSRVFVFFSGHGAPDPKTGKAYLVPWDGDAAYLETTGYPLARLYDKLSALPAREVVVALDACFSGAGGRSVLAKGARPLVAKVDAGAPSPRLTVLAAAEGDQITGALDDKGHGLFTYHLLQGMAGGAADASGRVTARALHDYLSPRVADGARRQNRDQTPVLSGDGARELVPSR